MSKEFWFVFGAFFFVATLGFGLGILVNYDGHNPPNINCNNESANDGPQYEERDITDYEWDRYCENF